jgi:hypothetical protein
MSREKPESFNPSILHSQILLEKQSNRRKKRLERYSIQRYLEDSEYFKYIHLRNEGYYDEIDVNDLINLSTNNEENDDPEDYFDDFPDPCFNYEAFVLQCPTLVCPGMIKTNDDVNFYCSFANCFFKITSQAVVLNSVNLIQMIRNKYIDHQVICKNIPFTFNHIDKIVVFCKDCEFYSEIN